MGQQASAEKAKARNRNVGVRLIDEDTNYTQYLDNPVITDAQVYHLLHTHIEIGATFEEFFYELQSALDRDTKGTEDYIETMKTKMFVKMQNFKLDVVDETTLELGLVDDLPYYLFMACMTDIPHNQVFKIDVRNIDTRDPRMEMYSENFLVAKRCLALPVRYPVLQNSEVDVTIRETMKEYWIQNASRGVENPYPLELGMVRGPLPQKKYAVLAWAWVDEGDDDDFDKNKDEEEVDLMTIELTNRGYEVEVLKQKDATASAIIRELESMYSKCRSNGSCSAVFYYSGHGSELFPRLTPYGYDPRDETTYIPLSFFAVNNISRMGMPDRSLVILDACYSGKACDNLGFSHLPDMETKSHEIIASSRAWEQSYTGTFTPMLLYTLRRYDMAVTSAVLFESVLKNTASETSIQLPTYRKYGKGPDFVFENIEYIE